MSDQNNMKDALKALQKELFAKKLEVNSLLEITQAINNNRESSELFLVYEFILRAQLQLKELALFIKPTNLTEWELGCCYGVDVEFEQEAAKSIEGITVTSETTACTHPFIKCFSTVVPVLHNDKPISYALISEETKKGVLSKEDLNFIKALTNVIAVAVENKQLIKQQLQQERMRREMELAGDIQLSLIPNVLPKHEKFTMASAYQPHSTVGGDYFDVFDINEKDYVVCVGDISGKGISAALLMSNFQANLRALVYQYDQLDELISILNERFTNITNGERFITFFIAKINKETGDVQYISCGHNPTLLVTDSGVEELKVGCTLLGMFDELPMISVGESKMNANDLLFMYTDGVIDVVDNNDEHFEEDRLKTFLQENRNLDGVLFKDQLFDHLNEYRQGNDFPDDIAFLLVKCK